MYDSRYMSHMQGSSKRSIFLTSFFSSSAVHVSSPETSICLEASISLMSAASKDCGVKDMFFQKGRKRKRS